MKILLAVDGSAYTQHMLAFVAAHGDFLRSDLQYTALAVVTRVSTRAARFVPKAELMAYYAEQANEVLDPVRRFAERNGWKVELRHALGPPADEIAELAEKEHFDLIVLGSHGHGALANLVLGSVVTGVLARCSTPVLIVRRPKTHG